MSPLVTIALYLALYFLTLFPLMWLVPAGSRRAPDDLFLMNRQPGYFFQASAVFSYYRAVLSLVILLPIYLITNGY